MFRPLERLSQTGRSRGRASCTDTGANNPALVSYISDVLFAQLRLTEINDLDYVGSIDASHRAVAVA